MILPNWGCAGIIDSVCSYSNERSFVLGNIPGTTGSMHDMPCLFLRNAVYVMYRPRGSTKLSENERMNNVGSSKNTKGKKDKEKQEYDEILIRYIYF